MGSDAAKGQLKAEHRELTATDLELIAGDVCPMCTKPSLTMHCADDHQDGTCHWLRCRSCGARMDGRRAFRPPSED